MADRNACVDESVTKTKKSECSQRQEFLPSKNDNWKTNSVPTKRCKRYGGNVCVVNRTGANGKALKV